MSIQQAFEYLNEGLHVSGRVMSAFQQVNTTNVGESHLKAIMDSHDLAIASLAKGVMLLAFSPFVTFGVGSETVPHLDSFPEEEGQPWGPEVLTMLEALAARQLTGHAAQAAMRQTMQGLDALSRDLLYRVLVKELRIGAGPKTINKYHKGLIPIFEHKGAKRTKEALHKVKWPAYGEFKLDGWRSLIKVSPSQEDPAQTYSRNGLPMDNLQYRAAELDILTRTLISEGVLEAIQWCWDGEGKKLGHHFNSTSSEASKKGKGADLTFNIWDLNPWSQVSSGSAPIEVRHARLDRVQSWLDANPTVFPMLRTVERFELDTEADAWELYDMARALGHEGLIIKQKGSLYTPGKTEEWVKVKPEESEDLVCIGTYMGDKGSKYEKVLGGIIVDFKGVPVRLGNPSDQQRAEWLKDPTLVVGKVIQTLYHEVTPDGSLREPRIGKDGIRKDKYPEDADGREGGNDE